MFGNIPILKEISRKALDKVWKEHATILHDTGQMFGIGGSAFDVDTAIKINELKKRPKKKGFIVLIPSIDWLKRFNIELTNKKIRLLEQYWPGNVTFIFPTKDPRLQHLSIEGTVGFRVPSAPLLRSFIELLDEPLISTSINKTGEDFAYNLKTIKKKYATWFDFSVLDGNHKKEDAKPSTIIEFQDDKLRCHREGNVPFYEIKESYKLPKICFVCTGNICRSPMAEFIAKNIVSKKKLPFRVISAGLLPSGNPISTNSYLCLKENSIEAHGHFSTKINAEILQSSWIVLVMEKFHQQELVRHFPAYAEKIFTLSEFAQMEGDIADPYGKYLDDYRATFKLIQARVSHILEQF